MTDDRIAKAMRLRYRTDDNHRVAAEWLGPIPYQERQEYVSYEPEDPFMDQRFQMYPPPQLSDTVITCDLSVARAIGDEQLLPLDQEYALELFNPHMRTTAACTERAQGWLKTTYHAVRFGDMWCASSGWSVVKLYAPVRTGVAHWTVELVRDTDLPQLKEER